MNQCNHPRIAQISYLIVLQTSLKKVNCHHLDCYSGNISTKPVCFEDSYSFSASVITMHSILYQKLHLLHRVARWLDNTDLSHIAQVLLGPGFGLMSPACIRSKVVTITGPFL